MEYTVLNFATFDIDAQIINRIKLCLFQHGFNYGIDDNSRLKFVEQKHFDLNNELYLDGVLLIKLGKISFKQEDNKMIGSFEYEEV